jgi:hypothetical protein
MRCWLCSLALALLFVIPAAFAVDGTFSGKVVDPPANQSSTPGWVFIQGRNHLLRRVEVAHAEILFGEDIPVSQRHKCNAECLSPGQEVRVTAHQDRSGEWHAGQVEILKIGTSDSVTQLTAGLEQEFSTFF